MSLKKIVHGLTIAALFVLPIFPLIVANSYFFPFITGKAFYFRLIVEIAFAGWVILAFVDAKYRPKLTPLAIGVTVFTLIAFVADMLGVNPLRSMWSNFERMEGWITIVHLWALFMVATNIFGAGEEGKRIWHRWLNVSLIVALATAGYGLFQLFGWADIHQGSTRLDASLGNSAYMAVYMMIHAFIASYLYFVARAKKIANSEFLKWAYPIMAVLFGFIVYETQTRGTILGLIGGIMLALFLYAVFAKGESKKARYISAGIIIAIVVIGFTFWSNRPSKFNNSGLPLNALATFIQNNATLNRLTSISWSEAQGQARNYVWPMAVKGAIERPIFGWGQENFNYIFNADYDPAMYAQEQWFDRAHSVFLDWLVASGFVGLIAYLALYVLFLLSIWKSTMTVAEKSVLTGLLAGYFVHNIFVFDNLASYVLFFAMIGFADSQRKNGERSLFGIKTISNDAVEYVVLPIVVVVFVGVVYFFQFRLLEANKRLITALIACSGNGQPDATLYEKALSVNVYGANQEIREQLLSCSGQVVGSQQIPGPTKQAFFTTAMNEIQNQIKATPKDARIYVLGGSFLNNIGQYTEAVTLLEKAHELSPRKQSVTFELATDYLNLGTQKDKAVTLLKEAYDSAPEYLQAKMAYATALVMVGKESDARAEFKNDPAVFNTEQMAQAFVSLKQYSKAIAIYKELIKANPTDVNTRAQLAQIQYTAGQISEAVATLRSIEVDRPELKDQIEAAIKQAQK
jgi:tetratricopeptide (TPR) repeat protein/O-antigen ligase